MTFTVADFEDLLRLLDERPDWQAELRRRVLSGELLALPALVRGVAEAQARSEERLGRIEAIVERLAEAQARSEERLAGVEAIVERLAEAQARSEERLGRIEAALQQTAEGLARLTARFEEHERRNATDLGVLKTDAFARRLAQQPNLFRQLVAEPQPLTLAESDAWLGRLVDEGRLSLQAHQQVVWLDLLVKGRRDGQEGYLVVEASWTIGSSDVDRAARRAALLREAGIVAWPAVVGYRMSAGAQQLAPQRQVLVILSPDPRWPEPD
ncbi:MAG: hypothetical protein HYY05_07465 [Chloroflexi bacterium]|nr:hypothetical protein [Chloroflexota bacterium]